LAVKSADHFPNTRSIKELLIKGASRTTKDNNGRIPLDMTKDINNVKLKAELTPILVRI
jgi:DNA-binding transcriptional regulator/RsmH inhibitor MraZ